MTRMLVGKPDEPRPLGKHGGKDDTKMDLKATGCGLDSFGSGYDRVSRSCEHGRSFGFHWMRGIGKTLLHAAGLLGSLLIYQTNTERVSSVATVTR
jgi:hypothetical protein